MLVLSRRVGETLLIGDNIRVTVLENRGSQVRIGIDAPADIAIDREEIRAAKDADKAVANGP